MNYDSWSSTSSSPDLTRFTNSSPGAKFTQRATLMWVISKLIRIFFKCKLSYFSKVRPQSSGGASSQPGADEEENRVFLLVVGLGSQVRFNLGSQVQLGEHILVASQRFYLDLTVLGILDFPSRWSLLLIVYVVLCQVLGILVLPISTYNLSGAWHPAWDWRMCCCAAGLVFL